MKVIFEGVNRSGKTTVARMLCDAIGAQYVKVRNRQITGTLYDIDQYITAAGYSTNTFYEDVMVMETIQQIFPHHHINGGVVLDRSLISAIAYNDLYPENRPIPDEVFSWWLEKVKMGGWLHIFLDCSYDVYHSRQNGNGETDDPEKFQSIRSSILHMMDTIDVSTRRSIYIDTTHKNPDEVLTEIMESDVFTVLMVR